jgi:hypothetical protein
VSWLEEFILYHAIVFAINRAFPFRVIWRFHGLVKVKLVKFASVGKASTSTRTYKREREGSNENKKPMLQVMPFSEGFGDVLENILTAPASPKVQRCRKKGGLDRRKR